MTKSKKSRVRPTATELATMTVKDEDIDELCKIFNVNDLDEVHGIMSGDIGVDDSEMGDY